MYSNKQQPSFTKNTTTMKERPEIVFVFKKADGTIERVSFEIPLLDARHDYRVPRDTLLHQVILKGAKRYSRVLISGQASSSGASERVETEEARWLKTQSITLKTPLSENIFIVFEVDQKDQPGVYITKSPAPRRRPVEGLAEKVKETISRFQRRPRHTPYIDYLEFTVSLDRK